MSRDDIISVFHQLGRSLTDLELAGYEEAWALRSMRWGSNTVSFELGERLKKLKKGKDGNYRLSKTKGEEDE